MPNESPAATPTARNASFTANPVLLTACVLALCAIGLYITLRQMLIQLPANRSDIDQLRTNAPALTRLMIVGATGILFNFASLLLSLFSYISSQQQRTFSAILLFISGSMLLVLFSIIFTSLIIG